MVPCIRRTGLRLCWEVLGEGGQRGVWRSNTTQWSWRGSDRCFIPYYDVDKMDMYKVHSLDELESLPLTEWNIRQHANTEGLTNALDTGGLDLIVVPGLAFSKVRCPDGGSSWHDGVAQPARDSTGIGLFCMGWRDVTFS